MRRAILLALALTVAVPAVAAADAEDDGQEQVGGRSGFWTSTRPAVGGAYRWRLLGVGVGLLAITGFVMLRMIRKASAERAAGVAVPRRR